MSYVEAAKGEELLIKFGDQGSPEAFTTACSVNTDRSIEFGGEIYTTQIARCDDPSKPSKTVRRYKSKDIKVSGAGMTDKASYKRMLKLKELGVPINAQVIQDNDNGWTVEGPWVIETLKTGGTALEEQAFDISLSIADDYTIAYTGE
jgi:hypothetical protein